MTTFHDYLRERLEQGGFTTEDALASFLALVRQVLETHESGHCAPLEGLAALQVEKGRIWFEDSQHIQPRKNLSRVRRMLKPESQAVDVIEHARVMHDVDTGDDDYESDRVAEREDELKRPAWLPGYVCWEHQVEHHDPLTDVFSLGLILASMACGLDLSNPADHEQFVGHRSNLFDLAPALHPVLAKAIVAMTELDRHQRPQDLTALLRALENYRDQDVDFDTDLARNRTFETADRPTKRQIILDKLQERLFEISKRNRLVHYKATMQSVNLTHSSIPLMFDYANVREDQIVTWKGSFQRDVLSLKAVSLNKHLNFREAIYLPGTLDRIRAESSRDEKEFGFAQLRLIICFLRWANLKEKPVERFESPLLLLPVRLAVKKGIHDRYSLTALEGEAEVNPVVRHLFKQLYDIDLPDRVDPSEKGITEFHADLNARIQASDAAVTLTKVDRRRIDIIHEKARRRLDQFRRRARLSGRGIRKFRDLDYSYDATNYHPLGIRIFEEFVRPARTQLEHVISTGPPRPHYAVEPDEPPTAVAEQTFFQLREQGDDNPFHWEFDLCSVTLSNLKYRRMSLVRDYQGLADDTIANPAFEATFSITPRDVLDDTSDTLPLAERYHVVPCDPTQTSAIALARTGTSYIIQGPPGTGKSQTITNLIADYVVRGKRVLFVCEKRAAIDVVYHRLKQRGLHELCCLIHDSQADKKEFVMDLKATYEGFLAGSETGRDHHSARREQLVRRLERELKPLQEFDELMRSTPACSGVPFRSMLDRLVRLRHDVPQLSPHEWERVPHYADWHPHRADLKEFAQSLADVQPDGMLAHHSLHLLSGQVADSDRPLELVSECLQEAVPRLNRLIAAVESIALPEDSPETLEQVIRVVEYARQAEFLADADALPVLDPDSESSTYLQKELKKVRKCDKEVATKQEATTAWREKLTPEDTEIALDQARQLEGRLLSVFRPAWWRLWSALNRAYDFSRHRVRPSWSRILSQLQEEHQALAKHRELTDDVCETLGIDEEFAEFEKQFVAIGAIVDQQPEALQTLHRHVTTSDSGSEAVLKLAALADDLTQFTAACDAFLDGYRRRTLTELADDLREVEDCLDELPDYLHCLAQLQPVSSALSEALRTLPVTLTGMEAATAERSLRDVWRAQRSAARFDGLARRRQVSRLRRIYDEWQKVNAGSVREFVRQAFVDNVATASKPAAQLTPDQKEFKKHYNRGRRELEHEFGKTMRYKAIRDLVADESGLVVRDLKPVWLMSPLSVSDTLPLNTRHFDVVIFDEASQITLEEAVPSIFRAEQTIVVGDDMQLPPTSFFASRREDDEDLVFEEDGEVVQYDLNSNSFLNHAARNLSSRMLGWHYRSQSESLISFSNHAFYDGRLLTVPDVRLPAGESRELLVESPDDGARHADELLDRAVSFHFMQHGVYDKRRNAQEAAYIAQLVRRILERDEGHSIGIVAFSEAQQNEIEAALQALAEEDAEFARLLELEWEREEDDQFVGLLVKNLENIQGDERDIIIMSVCYGPNREGRIRMNFGPINMSGGEKRLNVAFSRAKCHMALVASMRSSAITNDYNDGANCLKNYLRYAEVSSVGHADSASLVLRTMSDQRAAETTDPTARDGVTQQLQQALQERGLSVVRDVGQSHFRCDLAVSTSDDRTYRLGILVDTSRWYAQRDLLERELMKPDLLSTFGWQVHVVLARDWYDDREAVLERVDRLLSGEVTEDEDDADDEPLFDEPPGPDPQTEVETSVPADVGSVEPDLATGPDEHVSATDTEAEADSADKASSSTGADAETTPEAWSEYLEFVGGGSSKFWEITVNGLDQTVRFGRIGSRGQTRTKTFPTYEAAISDARRQSSRKQQKGYRAKSQKRTSE